MAIRGMNAMSSMRMMMTNGDARGGLGERRERRTGRRDWRGRTRWMIEAKMNDGDDEGHVARGRRERRRDEELGRKMTRRSAAIGAECRTTAGERLGGILTASGREAFDEACAEAVRAMGSRVENDDSAASERDRDVGRRALTSMEVEDVMYLRVVRELADAGGVGEARDEKRARLMQRCQLLQDFLPKGSDDYMINLVLRVFQNISDGSKLVNGAYSVSAPTLADVYTKCASFGYFLSASARRLELEQCMSSGRDSVHLAKLACPLKLMRYRILQSNLKAMEGESIGSPSHPRAAGYEVPVLLRAPGGIQIAGESLTLKQYVDQMGPSARARAAQIASVEASEVLKRHVSLLFATDRYSAMATSFATHDSRSGADDDSNEPVEERITIHMDQLKHTVLEASAFGATLANVERDIDCFAHLLTRA